MRRTILTTVAVALSAALPAAADAWNKKTVLTVSQPVMIPGKTLAPGKYVVKLVDSLSDRHIVQFTNEREDEVITTVLAIPNYRLRPTSKTQFEWWETPVGNPPAIRAWFYPGDNFGQEFAYPKGLSAQFAKTAQAPAPTVETQKPEELAKAPVQVVEPTGVVAAPPPQTYTPPKSEPVQVAEARPEPAPVAAAPEPAPAPRVEEPPMPDTASPYPLIALAGLAALAAGLLIRAAVPVRR